MVLSKNGRKLANFFVVFLAVVYFVAVKEFTNLIYDDIVMSRNEVIYKF